MEGDQEADRIEQLRAKLYSPKGKSIQDMRRHHLRNEGGGVREDWHEEGKRAIDYEMGRKKQGTSFLGKLLMVAVLFFVIALGVSAYLILSGANIVSSDNVAIDVLGPVTIEGGDELELQLDIKNSNNVPLEAVTLLVEYPSGARYIDDPTEEELRFRESLPNIPIGGSEKRTVRTLLFGEEGDEKEVSITLEYRVPGSNAIFSKETSYKVVMSSSPIILNIDTLETVTSGQEFVIELEVSSNSNNIIEDVVVSAEYPFGFDFTGASPTPDVGENTWQIGDLAPESKRTIVLRGKINAQDGEERAVRFIAGVADPRDSRKIGTPLLSATALVEVAKPFLAISVSLDGSSADTIAARAGSSVRADITWKNNLDTRITNAVVRVTLRGDMLDSNSINTLKGFFRASDNSITWDAQSVPELASLAPGESGRVNFSFASLSLEDGVLVGFEDEEIILDVSVDARKDDGRRSSEEVVSEALRRVRIESTLGLGTHALFRTGAFTSNGPLPPRVDTETTYTVVWGVRNMQNDATNVRAEALLPSFVRWTGQVSPESEDVRFDPNTGKVVWDIGAVRRGAGVLTNERTVSFQVALTPSAGQIGTSPVLVRSTTLTGRDAFTKTALSATGGAVTTELFNDSGTNESDWRVVGQ